MDKLIIAKQDWLAKGTHIFTKCKAVSERAKMYEKKLEECGAKFQLIKNFADHGFKKELVEEFQFWKEKLNREFKIWELVVENVTTTTGRNVFARLLANDNTYSGNVSHTALGSSNTAAAVGNTQLGTEVYRKALSSGVAVNNIAYLETFFTAAETNGTYEEYGNFIDGTGSANSGVLFNRFTQTVIKSSIETLNVQSIITLNDA